MVTVWLDEITPCLKDALTGDLVETEVLQIQRTSFLKKFNQKNGWYINWADPIRILHPNHFIIEGLAARKVVNDYDYKWSDDKL